MALHFLGKDGVLAVKSVSSSDMEKLSQSNRRHNHLQASKT